MADPVQPAPDKSWLDYVTPHSAGVVGSAMRDVFKHGGVPTGEVVEKAQEGTPDDPAAVFRNTLVDLGLVSGRAVQSLTSPANVALIGLMASGNPEAALPKLANLFFSAEMAKDATQNLRKGVEEARKGNLREAGRLFSTAGVNALLIAMGARRGPKGFTYRVEGSEPATAKLQGEVAPPPKAKTADVPLPTQQEGELVPSPKPPEQRLDKATRMDVNDFLKVAPPGTTREAALQAVKDARAEKAGKPVEPPYPKARGIVPPPVEVVPAPPDIIVHPRTLKSEGQAASVTPDDIRAYVGAKLGKTPMKVLGTNGEPQDLADDSASEAQRIREQKITKPLHDELFPQSKFRAGMTVGQAVDQKVPEKLQSVPPPPTGPEDRPTSKPGAALTAPGGGVTVRRGSVENKIVGEDEGKNAVPPPPLALTPTPAAKPVPEAGWEIHSLPANQSLANMIVDVYGHQGLDAKLVPDPNNLNRYWVSYKPKETAAPAPQKALGSAPKIAFIPAAGPKAAPWETHDAFVERRLKELTGQMISLMTEGKDIPAEVEAEHGKLESEWRESLARESRQDAEIEASRERVPSGLGTSERSPAGSQASQRPILTKSAENIPPEPTPEEKARLEVVRAGAEPKGVEQGSLLFIDPKTKSTLALPLGEVTEANIKRRMQESRDAIDAARRTDEPLEVGDKKPFVPERPGFMFVGGANRKVPVEYGYIEADDITPSHDFRTFTANPEHPGQQRVSYEFNATQKARFEEMFLHPEVERLLSDAVTALEGPPTLIPDGMVAGGNNRTGLIKRMYADPVKAKMLRDATIKVAQRNGAEGVENMRQPVRVRRIAAPDTMGEWKTLTADLNVSPAAPISGGELAVTYAGRITPSTMQAIAARLDDLNPDASIREFMAAYPIDFVRWVDESGALTTDDRLAYVDPETGGLNEDGKVLYETALLAKAFSDPHFLDAAPRSVIEKMASSLAPILRISARGGEWDIRPLLMEAAQVAGDAHARGMTVREHVDSIPLLSEIPTVGKVVGGLAEFIDRKMANVKKGFRQFAAESALKSGSSQGSFITQEIEPHDSFNASFTTAIEEPKPEPKRTKAGKVKEESAAEEAKRVYRNEESKRRMGRYQVTKEEFREALRSAHEARIRQAKER